MERIEHIESVPIEEINSYSNNPRIHSEDQIERLMGSIRAYGFTVPLVIDGRNEVVVGHGRLEAAKRLGINELPCVRREDITTAQAKALRIADNKVAESEWDTVKLVKEMEELEELGFDLEMTGFDFNEIEDLMVVPDFQPATEDDQPRLDEKSKVVCPRCGKEFTPP